MQQQYQLVCMKRTVWVHLQALENDLVQKNAKVMAGRDFAEPFYLNLSMRVLVHRAQPSQKLL